MTEEEYAALGLQAPSARIDPPGAPRDVAGLIARAAAQCPDDEALVDSRGSYSFRELDAAVTAVASLFDGAGIGAGDRVAASLGNENVLVIAFFAAMRLGAVWVGINKILPEGDKRYILAHSGAKLLLTDSSLAEQVEGLRGDIPDLAHVWLLDAEGQDGGWNAALADAANAVAPTPEIDPFAPAAIMYTSGTTGVPKGVVHSQHNMIVVPAAAFAHGLMTPEARRGSALPLTITNVMILGPVSAFLACKPFLFAPSIKIEPLIEWIAAQRIGQVAFVPTMIYDLLQAGLDLPGHFRMASGGAPLPHAVREAFFKRYGYHVSPSYGLTEAPTVVAHSFDAVPPEGASGHALPHLEISIRDADGNPIPAGTVGEVCFRATQTGDWANVYTPPLGYWREGEKTAALLRGGVVHSGDHGSLDADGWLTIADRSSELILRGGSNVYPAEIERVLHAHDDVADCAVVGKPDLRMGMLTVACVQPARAGIDLAVLEAELVALCRDKLTRYKVPDEWRFLDAFPRNAMGKVVKPKLRELVAPAD
ncbi:MAG TPA: class I adenylate-forming enzyme family protein [Sphingopyxis sp.]|nr:class I adenylate-forming enzyme family protein [Sphingopyxis sp.]HMP45855.1 class I adenylate-forming enzyme family protein [Sphingopyxis sp.]